MAFPQRSQFISALLDVSITQQESTPRETIVYAWLWHRHGEGPVLLRDIRFPKLTDGATIHFAKLHPEVRIADPSYVRIFDYACLFRGRNQEHHELHAHRHNTCATKASATPGEIFGHAAGMEISIGVIGHAGEWRPEVASFVWMRCHEQPVEYLMPNLAS